VKLRQGFVSNSSSSSFILAVDTNKKSAILRTKVDFDDIGVRIRTVEEYIKYMLEDYRCESIEELLHDYDYLAREYNAAINALRAGKHIIVGSVSNAPDTDAELENYFYRNGFSEMEDVTVVVDV
jgi:FMN phosphatase YigB (HAD superfamily)